jgi:hypothetical protein
VPRSTKWVICCAGVPLNVTWANTPAMQRSVRQLREPLRTDPIAHGADVCPPLSYRPPLSATIITPGTINTMVAMVRQVMVSRPK